MLKIKLNNIEKNITDIKTDLEKLLNRLKDNSEK
jgi:hypothetical protein